MTLSMGPVLERLLAHEDLSQAEARSLFEHVMAGQVDGAALAGLLVALRAKGEAVDEVAGAAEAMRAAALPVVAPPGTIDLCGTGGDGIGSVNISTAAALVVAAAGVPVAKHGNRSVSSKSGSADVLEALGIPVDADAKRAEAMLSQYGFAFLFAPNFHPAIKHAMGPRRALGVRTIFNLLGPLTNPAGVRRQLLGVFAAQWLEPLAQVLGRLGAERAVVVHADDGLDEISLAAPTQVAEWVEGHVECYRLTARDLGLEPSGIEVVAGGDAAFNAVRIRTVFRDPVGPLSDWIVANAAGGLRAAYGLPWREAAEMAREALVSGRATTLLDRLAES